MPRETQFFYHEGGSCEFSCIVQGVPLDDSGGRFPSKSMLLDGFRFLPEVYAMFSAHTFLSLWCSPHPLPVRSRRPPREGTGRRKNGGPCVSESWTEEGTAAGNTKAAVTALRSGPSGRGHWGVGRGEGFQGAGQTYGCWDRWHESLEA